MAFSEAVIHDLTCWIHDNIQLGIKINDVVARSGYSKWYLQKVFFQVKKKNLGKYIRDLKLFNAACDLVYSDEAIISISDKYGYNSQASFSRSFTTNYLFPPSEYRRLSRINFSVPNQIVNQAV